MALRAAGREPLQPAAAAATGAAARGGGGGMRGEEGHAGRRGGGDDEADAVGGWRESWVGQWVRVWGCFWVWLGVASLAHLFCVHIFTGRCAGAGATPRRTSCGSSASSSILAVRSMAGCMYCFCFSKQRVAWVGGHVGPRPTNHTPPTKPPTHRRRRPHTGRADPAKRHGGAGFDPRDQEAEGVRGRAGEAGGHARWVCFSGCVGGGGLGWALG